MTVVFLDHNSTSPFNRPSDWSDPGHTVEEVGAGGSGGSSGASSTGKPGTGGSGAAYSGLSSPVGALGSTTPFAAGTNNTSTTSGDLQAAFWEGTTTTNSYEAQSGLQGGAGGGTAPAGGNGVTNGTPSPVTYTRTSNSGGAGGTNTGSGTNQAGATGGGGGAGPSGAGQAGGANSATSPGGGGGGGGANNGTAGGAASTSTGGSGGNGVGGSGGGASGTTTGTSGSSGGGGGATNAATTAVTLQAGAGGTLGNVSNWQQTSPSASAGAGGGGASCGGNSVNAASTSGGGNGANYGGGGGTYGALRSTSSTGIIGTGANAIIVITYTPSGPGIGITFYDLPPRPNYRQPSLSSWTYGSNALTQPETLAGPVGAQLTGRPPSPTLSPVGLPAQTWTAWFNLNLIRQDQMPANFGGNELTDRPPVPPFYRDWSLNLQETTLAPVTMPPGKNVSDVPPRAPPRPDETWVFSYILSLVGQDQLPASFGNEIYDRPPVPPYYRDWTRGDLNVNELLQPPPPVGENYTERPPVPWYSRDWSRADINLTGLLQPPPPVGEDYTDRPPVPAFFRDWSLNLQETTLAPINIPVGLQIFDRTPSGPPPLVPSWAFSYILSLIGQDQLPASFGNEIYDRPAVPPYYRDWSLGNPNVTELEPIPPGENVSDRPAVPPWLRDWALNLQETTLAPPTAPAGKQSTDRPPLGSPPQVPSWAFSYILSLIGQDALPPSGRYYTERPPVSPWYRDWALNLQETTLFPGALPAGQAISDRPAIPFRIDETWAATISQALTFVATPPGQQVFDLARAPFRIDQTWLQIPTPQFAGAGPVPSYFWDVPPSSVAIAPPTPLGVPDNVLTPVPFPVGLQLFDKPPPARLVPPTWTFSYILSLVGQDASLVGKQLFDLPVQPPPQRRDWAVNLLQTTLTVVAPPLAGYTDRPFVPGYYRDWSFPDLNVLGLLQPPPPVGENYFDRPPVPWWYRDWTRADVNLIELLPLPPGENLFDRPTLARPSAQTWASSYILSLIGQDAFLVGKQLFELPPRSPIGPPAPTWTQGVVLSILAGQIPFNQYSWPLPTYPSRLDQTFARGYTLSLIGQDAFLVGKQLFDRPAVPPWYRDWGLIFTPYLTPAALPPGATYSERPPVPPFYREWIEFILPFEPGGGPVPTYFWDVPPSPVAVALPTYLGIPGNILTPPTFPSGAQSYALPPPPRLPPALTWTANRFLGLVDTMNLRIAQAEFALPPRGPTPIFQNWWSFNPFLTVVPLPAGQQSYGLPVLRPLPPAPTWVDYALPITPVVTGLPPGSQTFDLSPRAVPRIDETWFQTPTPEFGGGGPVPTYFWDVPPSPVGPPAPTWINQLFIELFNPPAPGKAVFDLPPRSPVGPPALTWAESPFYFPFNPLPLGTRHFDLPPRSPVGPPALTWTLDLVDLFPSGRPPIAQYDWPVPARYVPFRPDKTFLLPTNPEIFPSGRPPIAQYDWPLPTPPWRLDQTFTRQPPVPFFPILVAYGILNLLSAYGGGPTISAVIAPIATLEVWSAKATITPTMTAPFGQEPCQVHGATVVWSITWFDPNGNVVQPFGAVIEIAYIDPTDSIQLFVSIPMIPPTPPAVNWTVSWDSRVAAPGPVSWSAHSTGGPPFGVVDGDFRLEANTANLAAVF